MLDDYYRLGLNILDDEAAEQMYQDYKDDWVGNRFVILKSIHPEYDDAQLKILACVHFDSMQERLSDEHEEQKYRNRITEEERYY